MFVSINFVRNCLSFVFLLVAAVPFIISAGLSTPKTKAKVREILRSMLTEHDIDSQDVPANW